MQNQFALLFFNESCVSVKHTEHACYCKRDMFRLFHMTLIETGYGETLPNPSAKHEVVLFK